MPPEAAGPFLALAPRCHLKRLETPALYDAAGDRLYELDEEGLAFLASCPPVAEAEATPAARELAGFCRGEGLVAESAARRPVAVPPAPPLAPSLRYLLLHLTDRCTLRCRHCFVGPQTGADLPLADALRAADEFAALQGLRLIVSGGEPLLHRHFWRLNERLPAYPFRSILLTNGTMIDREAAAALRFDEVQVSVDGPEDAHDALRGRGSFRRAIGALRLLAAAGVPVSAATVVFSGNLERFDELAAILAELPLRGWSIDAPCPAGTLLAHPELLPDPARAGELMRRSFGGGFYGSSGGWACGAHLAAVMADGTVDKCGYFTGLRSGSVRDGLAAAWPALPRWRTADLSCRCSHLAECRGGCRFRAGAHDAPLGPDPALCHLRGVPVGGDRAGA
jgi:radical SAM protein with 4Fe4S-binding SPASM domain